MQRLETRLGREKYWDQTAYNEEIFFLSHDHYKSPGVRGRGQVQTHADKLSGISYPREPGLRAESSDLHDLL